MRAPHTVVRMITIVHPSVLTCPPWLGGATSQEQPLPVVRPPVSLPQEGTTNSGENAGVSPKSGLKGGGDRSSVPRLTRPSWPDEGTIQKQPLPHPEPRLRPRGYEDEQRGGIDRCGTPTKADMSPVATEQHRCHHSQRIFARYRVTLT